MIIRLLLSVLMLTGTFPARSCTCAAADASTPAELAQPVGVAVEDPPAVPEKACRCSHRSAARGAENAASISAAAHCPACSGVDHSHDPDRHQRDCPAVNPRPVAPAVQSPVAELPVDAGVTLPLSLTFLPAERRSAAHEHLTRAVAAPVPLYLSLLSIRI